MSAPKEKQTESTFSRRQAEYFQRADERKFWWMTRNPHFSSTEKDLVRKINALRPKRLLEVGCGEAGNLVNLDHEPASAVGVDLHENRSRFASQQYAPGRFVCGDAFHLPFLDGSFDLVFCRDLLHHVLEKERVVGEMTRTCRPGGHVVCIEACGRNPVIFCLAALVPAERGLLHSHPRALEAIMSAAGLENVKVDMHQPMPTYRILLHPRFGFPALGQKPWYRRWSDGFDRLFAKLIPTRFWAYAVACGRKPE